MLLPQGSTLSMPPGVEHSFTGVGPALILEVSMPSVLHDNNFADERIQPAGKMLALPAKTTQVLYLKSRTYADIQRSVHVCDVARSQ
jgi:D-lyxose ketol-isomerase